MFPTRPDQPGAKLAIRELQKAMRATKDTRLQERYETVLLSLHGVGYRKIAACSARCVPTVCDYLRSYRNGGIAALDMGRSTGRPRKLTVEQEQRVYDTIVHDTPADRAFPAEMNWTSPLVRSWIEKEFGVSLSDGGTRTLLYRLGLSYTMPNYTLAKADPVKQAAFLQDFAALKKQLLAGDIDRILFEDESMIRDYQAVGRTWFPKGQQKLIPTFGKHWGVKLIATLDYETGDVLCVYEQQYTAMEFLRFLKKVLERYPGERIVMILDNARIHHARVIQSFVNENADRLTLMHLPPYSPNLNPIEGLWRWLKSSVIQNVFFGSVEKIQDSVAEFIAMINRTPSAIVDRLCVQM